MSTVIPPDYNSDFRRTDLDLRQAFEGYLRERCGALWVEWNSRTHAPRAGYYGREQDESSRWSCWLAANAWTAAQPRPPAEPINYEALASWLRRFTVPGGWIYETEWQYDLPGDQPSRFGVNHTFVPFPPLLTVTYPDGEAAPHA